MNSKFDIVVVGSGPGGYPAAIRAAQRGKKVALVESNQIGGTCLNRGCIPSKALIARAEAYAHMQNASEMGIQAEKVTFDYAKMVEQKDQIVTKMRKNLEGLIASNGIEILRGKASFLSPKELLIKGEKEQRIQADKIILASGSEPKEIGAFPFDGKKIIDSTTLLEMKTLPKGMVIVGGGVIGCEFASLYSLLGVKVTILEMLPALLPMEDETVSTALTKVLQKRGVVVESSAKVDKIGTTAQGVKVSLASQKEYEADLALVAVGRSMNLQNLGLEKAGVHLENPSQIKVNDRMETNVSGIYAIGDIASKYWLAHVATHQGLIAADNACGHASVMHYNCIPNVIFTYPEIATVGISLTQAKKQGRDALLSTFPFTALGKAQAIHQTEGFAQLVTDNKTGEILGAQIVGHEASILISEVTLAMHNELTIESIFDTIHPHPTFGEAVMESALLAKGTPLHLPPRRK